MNINNSNLLLVNSKYTRKTKQEQAKSHDHAFMGDLEVIPEPWPVHTGQELAKRSIGLLLLALFSSLSALSFNPADLKKEAEENGLGYKTANLQVLSNLATHINQAMPAYFVTVPRFLGISSSTVHTFLKAHKLNIKAEWEGILERTAGPHQREKMLKNKQLNSKFKSELEKLQERIIAVCNSAPLIADGGLQDFLTTANRSSWQLMVRSTGKEDTETLANAGGNTSVANVPPSATHVMRALGEVVASYLSAKSMQQRLQAGDPSLFEVPFLPVLIQRMIGEQVGGAKKNDLIPAGCVLYTTETEGFTPGVALVQATWGHNEGVVQSSMPIDTFYLGKNSVYQSIKRKTKRLVPAVEKLQYLLQEQPNPPALIDAPSLPARALASLSIVARQVEKFYGKPMDLELVIMPAEQTIYLVQARPIVMPKAQEAPRYLKDVQAFAPAQLIPCTIINSNRGVLLEKLSAQNFLIASTLEKALTEFNELGEDKEDIKVIAVEEEAETTSHAAAVFRGEGKVIIRLAAGLKPLEDLMARPQAKLALSTQQGLLINLTDQPSLTPMQLVEGLAAHPTNLPLSIIAPANTWPQLSLPSFTSKTKKPVSELLMQLKTTPTDYSTLDQLCAGVKEPLAAPQHPVLASGSKVIEQEMREKYKTLQRFILTVAREMKDAATPEERIFHLRMLELALTQPTQTGYSGVYSYTTLQADNKAVHAFLQEVMAPALESKKISAALVQEQGMLQYAHEGYLRCLSTIEQDAWLAFLDLHSIHKVTPEHKRITPLLEHLRERDLLGGWLNTSLPHAMRTVTTHDLEAYRAVVGALMHEFESAQEQLKELDKVIESIMTFQPQEWENYKKFDALFARFTAQVVTPYSTEEFENLLQLCENSENNILKLVVITALKKITDRYDLFIKAIKSSTQYPNKTLKIKHFHRMLGGYVQLLEKVCDNEELINALKERLDDYEEENESELVVSSHFNVNVVVQQNTRDGDFTQQKFFDYISTLEDLFTSTHQLLLDEISKKIVAWNITSALNKPALLESIEEALELEEEITGLRFENTKVIFTYNRKLRAHSIQIELCYDCSIKKLTVSYHFYGFNEFLRWYLIQDYVRIVSPKMDIQLEQLITKDYGLSIYWTISSADKAHILDDLLDDAVDITFELSVENRKTIFENLDTTLEKLYEKCATLYGSEGNLISLLATTHQDAPFNTLTLPILDEIAARSPGHIKNIFKQAIKLASTHLDPDTPDNVTTAHYILAEVADALDEVTDTQGLIKQPKRKRLTNYKAYRKLITNLMEQVKAGVKLVGTMTEKKK